MSAMFGEMVAESTLSLAEVREATSGAPNAVILIFLFHLILPLASQFTPL